MAEDPSRRVQAILEERARTLARPAEIPERDDGLRIVVLVLGGERYGVEIQAVREIQILEQMTPVPGAPAYWAGVVNLRGSLYPVLDLRVYLRLPDVDPARMIAVVSAGGLNVALLAEDVQGVHEVTPSDIRPLGGMPEAFGGAIRGTTRDFLSVLDLDVLLSDPRLVVDEQPV